MEDSAAKQVARWVALVALFLIPLTPLVVIDSYFFPFITGKAFCLRILIEILVCSWAVLAFLDREYRPRFSWVGVIVLAFVVWMGVADLFALNVMKAFWSNFERMEGWVLLVHLLGFFVAFSSIIRAEKWRSERQDFGADRAWFLTSIGASLLVSGYALFQLSGTFAIHQGSTRIDASFGNSAYLAVYFLFTIFTALWLAVGERKMWIRWSLVAVASLDTVLIFFTETRGAILGLIIASSLAALLYALTAKGLARRVALGALAAIVVLTGAFYFARNTSFVQNNHVFQRIASTSIADGQTRSTIWRMAFKGFLERPFTGWGQEGFNYVFNKYYDPSLYRQEPWFDRAHNAFIDWLSAGGLPAFLLYLALFGSGFFLIWRRSEFFHRERIFLTAALVGYAVHNIFVFDNLYSYVYFFALLALIDSRSNPIWRPLEKTSELPSVNGTLYALPVSAVVLAALIWSINIPGMRVSSGLIAALTGASSDPAESIAKLEYLSNHSAFAAQEVREQIVNFAISAIQSQAVSNAEKQKIAALAVTGMREQVASYPADARARLELSYAYRMAGDFENARKEIQAALKLTPEKEMMWVEAGAVEWNAGNAEAAQKHFTTAYALGPEFPELAIYAAAGNISVGNKAAANDLLFKVFGTTVVDSDVLTAAYYRAKDWTDLIALWKARAANPSATAQTWFGLAYAYYSAGDSANAVATVKKAIVLFPNAKEVGASMISQIQAKPAPQ